MSACLVLLLLSLRLASLVVDEHGEIFFEMEIVLGRRFFRDIVFLTSQELSNHLIFFESGNPCIYILGIKK